MARLFIAVLAIIASSSFAFAANVGRPTLTFESGVAVVRGVKPAGRIVWMAVVRERIDHHVTVRVRRGIAAADAGGIARIEHAAAAAPRAVWSIADLDGGATTRGTPEGYTADDGVIVRLEPGQTGFTVDAAEVHLLYVRPPAGAWSFDGANGSDLDADGELDAQISISLARLRRLHGGPPPPDAIASGDVVLAIDPRTVRWSTVVVP